MFSWTNYKLLKKMRIYLQNYYFNLYQKKIKKNYFVLKLSIAKKKSQCFGSQDWEVDTNNLSSDYFRNMKRVSHFLIC